MAPPSVPPILIRPAQADDLDLVITRRLRFLADVRGVSVESFEAEFIDATRRFLTRTHGRTFLSWLAESDEACVGIVSVIVFDAPPRPEESRDTDGYVVNMHIDPQHRSAGVGDGRPLYESVGFIEEPGWLNRYG